LMELSGVKVDPATPPETHLVAPILPGVDGERSAHCPVCVTPNRIENPDGWVESTCTSCGIEFVATDGRPRPPAARPPDRRPKSNSTPPYRYLVDFYDRQVAFPFDKAGDLELAYCLSVHKMQGSQVPCGIVVCGSSNAFSQTRNWLYTAVTRSSETAVIVGDNLGIMLAAQKVKLDDRETLLRLFATDPETRPATVESPKFSDFLDDVPNELTVRPRPDQQFPLDAFDAAEIPPPEADAADGRPGDAIPF
jgi:hypothetical protein